MFSSIVSQFAPRSPLPANRLPVPTYTVTCLRNVVLAPDIYEFKLKKPAGFTFKPGQFVLFDVALIDNPADVQTRAFSIASAPSESELLFVAKMLPGGRASRWIAEMLREGTEVTMKGPFGMFTLRDEPDRDLLFVATSTGIAPFRSQIVEALEKKDARRMDVVFGVRAEQDIFWQEEFERLAQLSPTVFLHLALSNPSTAWTGHRGRVQTLVPQIVTDFSRRTVYVCGSPVMTKEVKELALGGWGVEKKYLHVEGYI